MLCARAANALHLRAIMEGMWGIGSSGAGWAANIRRSADRIGPAKKRRHRGGSGRPVGPRLVAGRGLKRRLADTATLSRWAVYLTLAVGIVYALYALLYWLVARGLEGIFLVG